MSQFRPGRWSHMNAIVPDLDACVDHLVRNFDANYMMAVPAEFWKACLIEIGGVIIELIEPFNFLLNSRHGTEWLGLEYESTMAQARAAVAANNLPILFDIDVAIFTDPTSGFGVSYEFFEGTFHGQGIEFLANCTRPAEYWRDSHPAGFGQPVGYTQRVVQVEPAAQFLERFLGANEEYRRDLPAICAVACGMRVNDHLVELQAPTGPGQTQDELIRHGQGIRSTVFGAKDAAQTRAHFEGLVFRIIEGTMPGAFALAPEDNFDLLFEFAPA